STSAPTWTVPSAVRPSSVVSVIPSPPWGGRRTIARDPTAMTPSFRMRAGSTRLNGGEKDPPWNSHVGLLGSGLRRAPPPQPRPGGGEPAPPPPRARGSETPRSCPTPAGRSRQIVQRCPVGWGHLTTGRGRAPLGTPLTVDPAPVSVVLQVGVRFTMRRRQRGAPSCFLRSSGRGGTLGAQPEPFRHHLDV